MTRLKAVQIARFFYAKQLFNMIMDALNKMGEI